MPRRRNRFRPFALLFALLALFVAHIIFAGPEIYLQIGAFINESNAEQLAEKTREEVTTPVIIDHGLRFHSVRLGPIDNRESADALRQTLHRQKDEVIYIRVKAEKLAPQKTLDLSNTPLFLVDLPIIDNKRAKSPANPPIPSTPHFVQKKTDKADILDNDELAHSAVTSKLKPNDKPKERAKTKSPANPPIPSTPHIEQKKPAEANLDNNGELVQSSTTDKINPNYKPKETPKRLWNLRQADIRSVINEVAKETGKNFIIDPRVQGKISIISGKPINAAELYPVFLSMLQVSGFAAIPSGKVIKIIPNIDARSQASDLRSRKGFGRGDEMVVQVVPVEYVSSEQLVPILRPLMPQWSNVAAYGPSNMLILSGRADNIKRLAYIIHQVDSSSSNGIDMVPLRNALAMDVVSTIKSLLDSQKSRSYQRHATVAADDKSNTILISGSKTERLRIRILISQLDRRNRNNSGNTDVVYLRYLRAQDLIPILAGVAKANFSGSVGTAIGTVTTPTLDSSTPVSGDSGSNNNSETPAPQQVSQNADAGGISPNTQASSSSSEGDKKPKVQIIAEPNTNSIIISAPIAVMRTLKNIIAKLDTRPAQVLVEALIAEIDENDVNQLRIDWGMVTNTNGTEAFNPGFAIINSRTRLSQFQVQLKALVSNKRANILSTPSVVVLDNRQAKILVGKEVSVQDSTYPGTGTGGGVANPYSTFTRQNVALHLYVRPQISQGNSIQLQIDHGNDTLADAASATNGRPVINKSSILTSVLVNSGDLLVLGGLVQNGLQKNNDHIPIIGDLPGVGELFQSNKRIRDKKVLMVFIRPIILSSERNNLQVTGSKYQSIRSEQLTWLQKEPFHKDNKELVLKPLKKLKLPPPFYHNMVKASPYERRRR